MTSTRTRIDVERQKPVRIDAPEPPVQTPAVEAPAADPRVALAYPECGHVLLARMLLGRPVGGVVRPGAMAAIQRSCPANKMPRTLGSCAAAVAITPELGATRLGCGFAEWWALATAETIIALAGPVAEEIAVGNFSVKGAMFDTAKSVAYARSVLYADGDPVVLEKYLDYCGTEARVLLRRYWPCVEGVAQMLLKLGTLDGEQIDRAILEALNKAASENRTAVREYKSKMADNAARWGARVRDHLY